MSKKLIITIICIVCISTVVLAANAIIENQKINGETKEIKSELMFIDKIVKSYGSKSSCAELISKKNYCGLRILITLGGWCFQK